MTWPKLAPNIEQCRHSKSWHIGQIQTIYRISKAHGTTIWCIFHIIMCVHRNYVFKRSSIWGGGQTDRPVCSNIFNMCRTSQTLQANIHKHDLSKVCKHPKLIIQGDIFITHCSNIDFLRTEWIYVSFVSKLTSPNVVWGAWSVCFFTNHVCGPWRFTMEI